MTETIRPFLNCSRCQRATFHNFTSRLDHWTCGNCNQDRHWGGNVVSCVYCPESFVEETKRFMRQRWAEGAK